MYECKKSRMMRKPNIYIGKCVRNDLTEKCSVKYENGTGRWVLAVDLLTQSGVSMSTTHKLLK